jgi:hypothetical protein
MRGKGKGREERTGKGEKRTGEEEGEERRVEK